MMKALEFSSKVINNQIQIPSSFEPDFNFIESKNIRVIVLTEEPLFDEDNSFMNIAQEQFFQGYSASAVSYDKI